MRDRMNAVLLPAEPGYVLLTAHYAPGQKYPYAKQTSIIGWRVSMLITPDEEDTYEETLPIALEDPACGYDGDMWAIQCPDGGVISPQIGRWADAQEWLMKGHGAWGKRVREAREG